MTANDIRHPAPPGPPGPPTHEHGDGSRCMWVRRLGMDCWRQVGHTGWDVGPCPGTPRNAPKPAEAAAPRDTDVYVVTTPRGFTETFNAHQIDTLVRLGLIEHERDGYVLEAAGEGVGPVHHFYREVAR